MNKEFIPYKQALALKELGFNEPCFAIWSGFDEKNFSVTDTIRLYSSNFRINDTQSSTFYINDFNSRRVSAPTFSQAFKWFRETYELYCQIDIYSYSHTDTNFEFDITNKNMTVSEYSNTNKSYEEAELKALKKLIEIVKNK